MALTGVGMVVCGVFTLESMMLHLFGFLLAVPLPAIGFLLAGLALRRTDSRLSTVGFAGGATTLVLFAVFMAIFDASGAGGNEDVAGLVQRVLILVALTTQSLLVVGTARHAARSAAVPSDARRSSARA